MKHFKFLLNDFFSETHVTTNKSNTNDKHTIQYQDIIFHTSFKVISKNDTSDW